MLELNEALNPINERVEIDPWRYIAAHGKNPRGEGGWYFTKANKDIDFHTDKEGVDYVSVRGKLKQAAEQAAKKLGVKRVWVQG